MIGLSRDHREQGGDAGREGVRDAEHASTLRRENRQLRQRIETVTERETDARYLATHDGLTGLANRSLLMDRYIQAAAHAQRSGRSVALLVFDVDGFKHVNDSYGHLIGDHVLQSIAGELEKIARAGDTACRYGGDEFMLLLGSVKDATDAECIAHKLALRIVDALRLEGIPMDVTASCGIAMYPEHGSNWRALVQAADHAMYRHKQGDDPVEPSTIPAGNGENGAERPMPANDVIARQPRSIETPLHQEPGFAGGDGAGKPASPRASKD